MVTGYLLKMIFGCLPVLVFLGALVHFDSFKLVRIPIILYTVAAGGGAAVAGYFINTQLMDSLNISYSDFMHFGAPFVEEILKAIIIVVLIQTNRIGFAFDAAILGFAAGTGFALIENFYYLAAASHRDLAVWVIRGFGTAIMHGGTTAIFAMVGHLLSLKAVRPNPLHYLPGLGAAIGLHATFNYFLEFPVMSTVIMMIILPTALTIILRRNQKSIHHWLEVDFAAHQELLKQIRSNDYETSPAGQFLSKLHERFDSRVVNKMIYYIELHTELILAAEEVLKAHERAEAISVSAEIKEKLILLHEIEEEIGKTSLLALRPHLQFNRHEFWELYMLEKEAGFAHPHAH
ncbi:MAG: PrsW family intramembrane metalloprotease [Alphaproteobacteria bacterium]|nr:PrsW family intramembrane metalloprotease [Alphaproteobacteria bacterium]